MDEENIILEKLPEKITSIIKNLLKKFGDEQKYQKLSRKLKELKRNLEVCCDQFREIESFACEYDIDKHTRANGYRSFVDIFDAANAEILKVCKKISVNRRNIFFRVDFYKGYVVQSQQSYL